LASIEKRKGKWRVRVSRKGFRRESATFIRRADALAWANKRETEINAGRRGQIIPHTVKEALERYRDTIAPLHRGEQWERVRLNKLGRELAFRHRLLAEVTTDDIARWRDAALQTLKPASVRREMGLLRLVFEACRREWRWLRENPMDGVKRPLPGPARNRLFADAEVAAICARLESPGTPSASGRVALALRFALETALRAGELCGLTWGAINAPLAFLTLPRTKNGDARDVPLSKAALAILKTISRLNEPHAGRDDAEHSNRRNKAANDRPKPDQFPAGSESGQKRERDEDIPKYAQHSHSVFGLSTGVLDTLFRRARDAEGIKGLHFHDARATAITRLSAKLDILELARMVGHRDLKSLMIYYRQPASEIAGSGSV
jgi:integrase